MQEDFVKLIGLQVSVTSTGSAYSGIICVNNSNCTVEISHCIVRNTDTATNASTGISFGGSFNTNVAKVFNNIVYDFIKTGAGGTGISASASPWTLYAYNNTVINLCFFFNDTATTEIYTLSLHDALPISKTKKESEVLVQTESHIKRLTKAKDISIDKHAKKPENSASALVGKIEVFVPMAGLIDLDKENARLKKEIGNIENEIKRLSAQLKNKNFVERAPKEIVQKEKDKIVLLKEKLDKLNHHLKAIKKE